MARVNYWDEVRWVWLPNGFHLGKVGVCCVMAGMRGSALSSVPKCVTGETEKAS
jgi:hypothetical protein